MSDETRMRQEEERVLAGWLGDERGVSAAEAEPASGSKKGVLWGVLGILAVAGLAAAMVGGAGGGGGDDDPKTGGISASW